MNDTNDSKQREELNRKVIELEQLINQLDDQNANYSIWREEGLNLDNISFKGAEIVEMMELDE